MIFRLETDFENDYDTIMAIYGNVLKKFPVTKDKDGVLIEIKTTEELAKLIELLDKDLSMYKWEREFYLVIEEGEK